MQSAAYSYLIFICSKYYRQILNKLLYLIYSHFLAISASFGKLNYTEWTAGNLNELGNMNQFGNMNEFGNMNQFGNMNEFGSSSLDFNNFFMTVSSAFDGFCDQGGEKLNVSTKNKH